MRIAQVSPLHESVPPKGYGGTERVVSYLTEELVRRGHDVTLYASGDSQTRARLVAPSARSLRLDPSCVDPVAHHVLLVERVVADADWFDVIHWHIDHLHLPFARRLPVPSVTTLHGRLDGPDLVPLFAEFHDAPLISISDNQRRPLPAGRWVRTVHHGLPRDLYQPRAGEGGYLAFLGRTSPEKGLDQAIEMAVRAGLELKIAAKVDKADRAYFDHRIRPLLDQPGIEMIGEIGEDEKQDFLGGARALLFPIDWPEPFGLVMIEANACSTPVIAYPRGSVPEIIEDGVNGRIVRDVDEGVRAIAELDQLDRDGVRRAFESRFSVERMADDYLHVYSNLQGAGNLRRIASK